MNVLEILLNRRWILKSRDRELYYQVKEKLASGEEKKFLVSGDCKSLFDQGRKNACCAGKLDGDFGL